MLTKAVILLALGQALAAPVELESRQSGCPNIHVFGARETTAPAGYGSAGTFVNLILNAHPGATAEAINYPAAGGTDAAYASSVQAGVQAVANAVNSFNTKCPNTELVLVGYSQVSASPYDIMNADFPDSPHRELRSKTTLSVVVVTPTMASPIPTL